MNDNFCQLNIKCTTSGRRKPQKWQKVKADMGIKIPSQLKFEFYKALHFKYQCIPDNSTIIQAIGLFGSFNISQMTTNLPSSRLFFSQNCEKSMTFHHFWSCFTQNCEKV